MYPASPPPRVQHPPCARCGSATGGHPLLSPQGHLLCGPCYHALGQAAANERAAASVGSGVLYLGNDRSVQAGLRGDMEAKLLRRCAKCQAHAVTVVNVTFHYVNGITRGRTYDNACSACGSTFKTESVLRAIAELGGGIAVTVVGACGVVFGSGWSLLFALGVPLGLWMTGQTVVRIVARFRNPIVPRLQTR